MRGNGRDTFGWRVKTQREILEMTVEGLADKCGVRSKTVERWERGETEPQIDDAARVAVALGVSLDYLAGVNGAEAVA
jgi:transcriptional regulator with XRE-family HTH domain